MSLGEISYLAAATGYGFLLLLLIVSWRGSLLGRYLSVTVVISLAWALTAGQAANEGSGFITWYKAMEIARFVGWYLFLIKLLEQVVSRSPSSTLIIRFLYSLAAVLVAALLVNEFLLEQPHLVMRYGGHVFLSLFGLVIIEQLYRNSDPRNRWSLKYLFLGVGAMFAYDFYLYANALLFMGMDRSIWQARGLIHVIIVPLILIASSRNRQWTRKVFVSRDIVFNTTAILAGGVYLLAMSAAGYYLREFGGDWGRIGELVFIFLVLISLAAILFSSSLRSQLRVFLGKHFFSNKYDYRVEWLRLTESLGDREDGRNSNMIAIEALANTVEARAGMLWLQDEAGVMHNIANWNLKHCDEVLTRDDSLVRFLEQKGFVINLFELNSKSHEYEGLMLPGWLLEAEMPWLIVPLYDQDKLFGFILLCNPLVSRVINWEDRDLLKTAARQVANYILARISSEALAEAKQFEVFSRLSAYMVHDLKNIASELEMVAQNATRHRTNPEFVEDAFSTVENAAGDIQRLLDQLRNRQAQERKNTLEDLADIVCRAAETRRANSPVPVADIQKSRYYSVVEKDRLLNVMGHLIENAQQATADDGSVRLSIKSEDDSNIIRIQDDGHGMDQDFIKQRLFKPFDTTKGNAGMGIGMYESREFIRQLGGDIKVESSPGRGTLISLLIPAASAGMRH